MELRALHQYADHFSAWKQKRGGKALGIKPRKGNVYYGANYGKLLIWLYATPRVRMVHIISVSHLFPLPSGGCHRLGLTVSTRLFLPVSQHHFWNMCICAANAHARQLSIAGETPRQDFRTEITLQEDVYVCEWSCLGEVGHKLTKFCFYQYIAAAAHIILQTGRERRNCTRS